MEEVKGLKITDITYVHDAEAMQRWLDLYVLLFKESLFNDVENLEQSNHKH
ncbi:hypothetical protein ['Paenibacillus yunnanensis' Narsing Rao et al. 2020]|uniref:hypothetical protein n=1 Tax=Paenibacillus tengchongensis TaxID=2608684 RepID=UPI001652456D|nr:hypothetical protein [Paenibacillus tengchongensis]